MLKITILIPFYNEEGNIVRQLKEKKRTNYILLKHSSYGEIAEKERDL